MQMTPKDKAEELIEKFEPMCSGMFPQSVFYNGVECAIIAVEEIKENEANNHSCLDVTYEYWDQVLTELKSMQ